MHKLISFTFTQPAGKNFTPSAKIHEYAQHHNHETFCRYHVEQLPDGIEKVTIYLED